ncbi:hypothetical protein BS47DRAFT_1365435, partial [Hydnum rufescens UP504]
ILASYSFYNGPSDYSVYQQEFAQINGDPNHETRLWPFIPFGIPQTFLARHANTQWYITVESQRALARDWTDIWDMAMDLQHVTRLLIPDMARVLRYCLESPKAVAAEDLFTQQFSPWFHLDVLHACYYRIYRVIQVLRGYCNYTTIHKGFTRGQTAPTATAIPFPFPLGILWSNNDYGPYTDCSLTTPYCLHQVLFYSTSIGELEIDPVALDHKFITSHPPPDDYLNNPLAAHLITALEEIPSLPGKVDRSNYLCCFLTQKEHNLAAKGKQRASDSFSDGSQSDNNDLDRGLWHLLELVLWTPHEEGKKPNAGLPPLVKGPSTSQAGLSFQDSNDDWTKDLPTPWSNGPPPSARLGPTPQIIDLFVYMDEADSTIQSALVLHINNRS